MLLFVHSSIGGSMTKIVHTKRKVSRVMSYMAPSLLHNGICTCHKIIGFTFKLGKTSLHMTSYPGGDFNKLVERLHVIINDLHGKERDTLNICTTGIGSNFYKRELEKAVNIRYKKCPVIKFLMCYQFIFNCPS